MIIRTPVRYNNHKVNLFSFKQSTSSHQFLKFCNYNFPCTMFLIRRVTRATDRNAPHRRFQRMKITTVQLRETGHSTEQLVRVRSRRNIFNKRDKLTRQMTNEIKKSKKHPEKA